MRTDRTAGRLRVHCSPRFGFLLRREALTSVRRCGLAGVSPSVCCRDSLKGLTHAHRQSRVSGYWLQFASWHHGLATAGAMASPRPRPRLDSAEWERPCTLERHWLLELNHGRFIGLFRTSMMWTRWRPRGCPGRRVSNVDSGDVEDMGPAARYAAKVVLGWRQRDRTGGETGRRSGFRFRRRKACGFNSRPVHIPNPGIGNGKASSSAMTTPLVEAPEGRCISVETKRGRWRARGACFL